LFILGYVSHHRSLLISTVLHNVEGRLNWRWGCQVPGPLIWAPVSEEYGRRFSILGPVFIFACFTAATAVAKDPQVRAMR
jgi:hypothetical protein